MQQAPTRYLGQYVEDNAERICDALDEAGIVWHRKSTGRIGRLLFAGEWGVRLFAEEARFDEARAIADRIAPDA